MLFFPVVVVMFTAVLYQAIALTDTTGDLFVDGVYIENETAMGGGLWENETGSSVEVEGYGLTVGFDAVNGALVWLVSLTAVAVVAGISVLGSGLKEFTVKYLVITVGYFSFWGIVSVFAIEAYNCFPFGFGWMFYLFITVMYSFGVLEAVST